MSAGRTNTLNPQELLAHAKNSVTLAGDIHSLQKRMQVLLLQVPFDSAAADAAKTVMHEFDSFITKHAGKVDTYAAIITKMANEAIENETKTSGSLSSIA